MARRNPDRGASFDEIFGHMGPTKRAIMTVLADLDGKTELMMRRNAGFYARNSREQEAHDYFIDVRHRAERLIKALREHGVPVGWTS